MNVIKVIIKVIKFTSFILQDTHTILLIFCVTRYVSFKPVFLILSSFFVPHDILFKAGWVSSPDDDITFERRRRRRRRYLFATCRLPHFPQTQTSNSRKPQKWHNSKHLLLDTMSLKLCVQQINVFCTFY